MAASMQVRGLIARETVQGEQDKRLTLICVDQGRVYVSAKGAKKQGARLASSTQVFTYGDFWMNHARSGWVLQEAVPIEQFYPIRQDPEQMAWASWMLETALELTVEEQECNEMLRILLRGLQMITEPSLSPMTTASAFVLRALASTGVRPETDRCVASGHRAEDPAFLSVEAGGLLCADCARRYADAVRIQPGTLYAMRYILSSDDAVLYKFQAEPQIRRELFEFAARFLTQYLQREPKTLRYIRECFC
jgi:DNA repair protein RecO (recombination protein O)